MRQTRGITLMTHYMKIHFVRWIFGCVLFCFAIDSFAAPQFIKSDAARGTSLAVVAENVPLVHTTQFFPLDKKGKVVGGNNAAKQIQQTLENLEEALKASASDLDQIVKINVVVAKEEIVAEVEKVFSKKFKKSRPATSFVVGGLPNPAALVAMDAVAQCKTGTPMKRISVAKIVDGAAFAQVSSLSPGGAVYVSGQAKPGELAEATTKTLESLGDTLKFLKLEKTDVVQIKCFIQPASDAEIAKKQIANFFEGGTVPPLVFIDWISPKLPIEIEMIVAAPENRAAKESITYLTPPGFQPSNVYSKVARVNYGRLVYVSGLYGNTPQNPEKQILEIFDSLKQIAQEAGSNFDSLAKATYYVSSAEAGGKLNELRPKFYNPKRPPAASKALVKGVGREGMGITFDMIAVSEK